MEHKIVLSSARDIYVVNVDGTNLVNLTEQHPPGRNEYPSWSQDGRQILFQTTRDCNKEIYLMDADGSNPVNPINHPREGFFSILDQI